jgi:hypothetical protein
MLTLTIKGQINVVNFVKYIIAHMLHALNTTYAHLHKRHALWLGHAAVHFILNALQWWGLFWVAVSRDREVLCTSNVSDNNLTQDLTG